MSYSQSFCRTTQTFKDYDYDYETVLEDTRKDTEYTDSIRMLYVVAYITTCTLGLTLNLMVIIARSYRYRKSNKEKSDIVVWVLSLAATHLVYSAFLVLQFLYVWNYFNWRYGTVLCKLSSYIIYACMFSTAAMLSLWSISRCECIQWISNRCHNCVMSMDTVLVLMSLTFGALLGTPSLLSRQLRYTKHGQECIDDYDMYEEKPTDDGVARLKSVVLCRFMLGALAPAFVMTISWCFSRRQNHHPVRNLRQNIVGAIKVAYLVCWTPLLLLSLIQVNSDKDEYFKYGMPMATVLSTVFCFINPVIYMVVGRSVNMKWMSEVEEDGEEIL